MSWQQKRIASLYDPSTESIAGYCQYTTFQFTRIACNPRNREKVIENYGSVLLELVEEYKKQ